MGVDANRFALRRREDLDQPGAVVVGRIPDVECAIALHLHAGLSWPGATEAWNHFQITGRSTLRPLEEPALICLRTRAMFGVGARAEILRHMLVQRNGGISVARLAELVGYAKRNVAEECETLELAGLLTHRTEGNRFLYAPARRADLGAFIGDVPEVFPDWRALTSVVLALPALEIAEAELPHDVFIVEVHRSLDERRDDLDELGFDGPSRHPKGAALWPEVKSWADLLLANLARGEWPGSKRQTQRGISR